MSEHMHTWPCIDCCKWRHSYHTLQNCAWYNETTTSKTSMKLQLEQMIPKMIRIVHQMQMFDLNSMTFDPWFNVELSLITSLRINSAKGIHNVACKTSANTTYCFRIVNPYTLSNVLFLLGEQQATTYYFRLLSSSPFGQMAAILATNILKYIFLNENDIYPIQNSLKFVPRTPFDHKPASVQIMAWRRTGDTPLPEPMLTQFTDAYMRL